MSEDNPSFRRERSSKSIDVENLDVVKGFQVDTSMTVKELLKHYNNIGFQATNVGRAAELIKKMKEENVSIFLSYTSNMISSGMREIIAQLAKNKLIKAIITSTGSIEEDIMKSKGLFFVGSFESDDEEVKKNKLNRIGNIYVKDDSYVDFEAMHMKFMKERHAEKKIWAPSDYIQKLGETLQDENSVLYWAAKNNIPIICPGFVDGAIGDHFFYFNEKNNDKLVIDQAADITKFYKIILQPEKTGAVILGGGIAKHHLIGAAILRNGLDYAVYISTGTQYDGSLSGAQPKEAVSWNKLKQEDNSVVIEGDATMAFPLLAFEWLS